MSFSFLNQPFVFAAVALALAATVVYWLRRKPSPALFTLAAGFLCLLAAGPVMRAGGEPQNAAILDVSGSMESRLRAAKPFFEVELAKARGTFNKLQLSDALRNYGDPAGGRTNYASLSTLGKDAVLNGEYVLMTDGRGRLDELLGALDPSRVTLLRVPPTDIPDAAIVSLRGPSLLLPGASGTLNADIRSDRDAEIIWRVLAPEGEAGRGTLSLKAGLSQSVKHTFIAPQSGLLKLRFVIECVNDREPRNNVASLAVAIGGKRVILDCSWDWSLVDHSALIALLKSDPNNEIRAQDHLPASAAELEGVTAVVIADRPLSQSGVSSEGLAPLANWVRTGGRLLMGGAREAFGPGGYRGTALEDLMPVTFRPDDDKARRFVLLLDCSDSMRAAVGGQTRLDLLKQAALRVLGTLSARDFAAIAGFSDSPDAVEFLPLTARAELEKRVAALTPRTNTHIRSALSAALNAFPEGASEQSRVMLITDGDDNEGSDDASWRDVGALAKRRASVDVVLTESVERSWVKPLREGGAVGRTATVGAGGFAEILKALELALAGSEEGLIDDGSSHGGFVVPGVDAKLGVLCRTAPRPDLRAGDVLLEALTPPGDWKPGHWPLIAKREMVGRSVAVCTECGGAIWQDSAFIRVMTSALDFLLGGTQRANLQLNARDEGAELQWIGAGAAPQEDLRLSTGTKARLVSTGLWALSEYPQGDEVQVFAGEKLLQRVALAQYPPRELTLTGDDEAFFAVAQERGIRVVTTLEGWKPASTGGQGERNLAWVAGLLAVVCLLAGYGLRRR